MKKTEELLELRVGRRFSIAVFTIALGLLLPLFWGHFSFVSHAESMGRIKAYNGVKVRSSASSNASIVSSLEYNETVSIISQVEAGDGIIWYEVWVDADTKGYIRSDLVEITDGTTPDTPAGGNNSQSVNVTRVNPVSATIKSGGAGAVRIRSTASTNGEIITAVQDGTELIINGLADSLDREGQVWYQVNLISNGSEISGFIRQDFVELSGELTPYTESAADPGTESDTEPTPSPPVQPEVPKEYDTFEQDGKWFLKTPEGAYDIAMLLESNAYVGMFSNSEKTLKSQKIAIVTLVILLLLT